MNAYPGAYGAPPVGVVELISNVFSDLFVLRFLCDYYSQKPSIVNV
jgi:hypothetical protein